MTRWVLTVPTGEVEHGWARATTVSRTPAGQGGMRRWDAATATALGHPGRRCGVFAKAAGVDGSTLGGLDLKTMTSPRDSATVLPRRLHRRCSKHPSRSTRTRRATHPCQSTRTCLSGRGDLLLVMMQQSHEQAGSHRRGRGSAEHSERASSRVRPRDGEYREGASRNVTVDEAWVDECEASVSRCSWGMLVLSESQRERGYL